MDLHRKSPRAQFPEYNEGRYFITVCTHDKVHYFGEIHDGEMHLSAIGRFVENELVNVKIHHPHVEVPLFVVMPNHWHAIVCIGSPEDAARSVPTLEQRIESQLKDKGRTLLSAFVGSVKSSTTRFANLNGIDFRWQERYHDHVIRGYELNMIAEYIEHNVGRWDSDCFRT